MIQESSDNPYKTPEAHLAQPTNDKSILSFSRFSAWWVFALTIVTFGIYPYFWMYSRTQIINSQHNNKISSILTVSFLVGTLFSYASSFFGQSHAVNVAVMVITLVFLVLYIVLILKMRNRLQDIINRSSNTQYRLNRVLAIFFYAIYLQYKIKECIDELPTDT